MRARTLVALACLVAAAAGCGGDDDDSTATSEAAAGVHGAVTVSAAASLTDAFTKIGDAFETANPDAKVTFNFGPSSTLETQIEQGAPADVFASADEANMDKLDNASKLAGASTVFARNKLVIITKPGNPKNVRSLADLADVGTVSLCGAEVPCGKYAAQVLEGAGVTIPESSVTRGQDVKATLAAVTTGDADAGIVYVTDAKRASDAVTTVEIPDDQNAIAVYPIALLARTGDKEAAPAFVAAVTADDGQATLQSFGFLPPR
jgi:molybdate transport system substrate-binding protein